jgi:hypothetical protein
MVPLAWNQLRIDVVGEAHPEATTPPRLAERRTDEDPRRRKRGSSCFGGRSGGLRRRSAPVGIVLDCRDGGPGGFETKGAAESGGQRRDPIAKAALPGRRGRSPLPGLGPKRLEVVIDVHDRDGVHGVSPFRYPGSIPEVRGHHRPASGPHPPTSGADSASSCVHAANRRAWPPQGGVGGGRPVRSRARGARGRRRHR